MATMRMRPLKNDLLLESIQLQPTNIAIECDREEIQRPDICQT